MITEIPKVIHLCWFSGDSYPPEIKKCLRSWKRIIPDYKIKVWTKEMALGIGFDFVKEAISAKKWAFAADVVRLYAIYTEGGIYMDSDILLLKRFDEFMKKDMVFFQECHNDPSFVLDSEGNAILTSDAPIDGFGVQAAFFMGKPGSLLVKSLLDYYKDLNFILPDGSYRVSPIAPTIYAKQMERLGYKYTNKHQYICGADIYSSDYIGVDSSTFSDISFAIHCAGHSWAPYKKESLWVRFKIFVWNFLHSN